MARKSDEICTLALKRMSCVTVENGVAHVEFMCASVSCALSNSASSCP